MGADVTVTNTGKLAGDEVVQLYLKFPDVKGAPRIALRGFERVHLDAGASQKVHFDLKPRDMGMVTEDGNPIISPGEYTISIGGGQPERERLLLRENSTLMGSTRCRNNEDCAAGSESRNFEANDCINTRGEAVHGEVEGVYCSYAA